MQAVMVGEHSRAEYLGDASRWLRLAVRGNAIPAAGIWEKYFDSWGLEALERGKVEAAAGFDACAKTFIAEHSRMLESERKNLAKRLRHRALEITGELTEDTHGA
jgi:hypothetical protein